MSPRRAAGLLAAAFWLWSMVGPLAGLARAAVPTSFTFRGSGWGHGVGMSQYGAYGQALAGATAAQILEHYYAGATVGPVTDGVALRVSLHDTLPTAQVRGEALAPGAGTIVVTVGATPITGAAGQVFSFSVTGSQVAVSSNGASVGSAPVVGIAWSSQPTLLNVAGTGQSLDDSPTAHRYRWGAVDIAVVNSALQVVNELSLHGEYLRGVAEMPSSWSPAALQAQVVAARSYALSKYQAGLRTACRCHVFSDSRDQVFAGWAKETEPTYGTRWVAAVDATSPSASAGLSVLTSGGVVEAFYFSSSGGHTENNEDGFGAGAMPVSWLRSVDDHWSLLPAVGNPNASWSRTVSQARLAALFGLPDVVTINLGSRTAGGAVKTAVATSSGGATSSISGLALRNGLGLPSAWIGRPVLRLAGADRYATSVTFSQALVADPSGGAVVVASGEDGHLVDGLVAAPLATAKQAPILLATVAGLPPSVAAEIDRLHPSVAFLVGGTSALGPGVVANLQAHGVPGGGIRRVDGADRYATAAAVARELGGPRASVVVASGDVAHLVDALTSGGPAGTAGQPVLLVSVDQVPPATHQALGDLGTTTTAVVGGPTAVSDATMSQLPGPTRLAGPDRYTTAEHVADHFLGSVPTDSLLVASGEDAHLVDALAAGAFGRVTLLTQQASLDGDTAFWLEGHPEFGSVYVTGGLAAVSDATVAQIGSTING